MILDRISMPWTTRALCLHSLSRSLSPRCWVTLRRDPRSNIDAVDDARTLFRASTTSSPYQKHREASTAKAARTPSAARAASARATRAVRDATRSRVHQSVRKNECAKMMTGASVRPAFFCQKRKLTYSGWWSDVTVYRYWRFRPTSASPGFIASFFGLTAPQSSGNQVLALHQPHQPPSCPRRLLTD